MLDNFDHLLGGAGLLSEVLAQAPAVKMLVTSRERLNLQEEWVLEIWGLRSPSNAAEEISSYSEVQLFRQTARRVQSGSAAADDQAEGAGIVRICQLVGGMPLALELAASWARTLSCAEIAREIERSLSFLAAPLRNLPERHRSLQAVFDHSWTLLSPPEQAAFQKLSVFRGGFGRDGAEHVAGASLATLSALLDKSLVQRAATDRYDLHELIRQFTWQKLAEAGELEPVRRRHLEFFLATAEQADPELRGAKSIAWLDRLEREHDNLRAALAWSLEDSACVEWGPRLAGALGWLWWLRGHYTEGRTWLARTLAAEAALAAPAGQARLTARGKALHWAAFLAADLADAAQFAQLSLDVSRAIGDRRSQAYALCELANVASLHGDIEWARSLNAESLALFRELDDVPGTLHALAGPVGFAKMEGDLRRAEEAGQQMLGFARQVGDVDGTAYALLELGLVALHKGEYVLAGSQLAESASLFGKVGNRTLSAASLAHLGLVAVKQGQREQAGTLLRKYLIVRRATGLMQINDISITAVLDGLADLAAAEGRQHGRLDPV